MGLADRLASERPEHKPRFRQIIDALDPADAGALIAAAKDPAWSNAGLIAALRKEGIVVGKEAFKNWRDNVTGG
jgi:hypothetical protein